MVRGVALSQYLSLAFARRIATRLAYSYCTDCRHSPNGTSPPCRLDSFRSDARRIGSNARSDGSTIGVLFVVFIFLFGLPFVSAAEGSVSISEIMYNPEGDDSMYEFIELYAENLVDVSGYSFDGISFVFPQNYSFSGFLIIASSAQGFAERYHASPAFEYSGSLRNTGELITIRTNGSQTLIFAANYSDSARAGYSLEWTSQGYVEGILGGTPGEDFVHISSNTESSSESSSVSVALAEISSVPSISSASSSPVPSPPSSVPVQGNHEKKASIASSSTSTTCNPLLSFSLDKDQYLKGDTVIFTPSIMGMPEKSSFELRYHIEDGSGNTAKSELVTQNREPKRYTPQTIRRRETFSIIGVLRVPCTTRPVQSRVSFLVQNNDSFFFEMGKLPSTIHYGDMLAVPLTISPNTFSDTSSNISSNTSVSSDVHITIPELINLSFAVSDFMNITPRIQIPDRCDRLQPSIHTNLSLEYAGKKIAKELLILPSKNCNLPQLRNVYSRVQNLTVGKNITLFVSFESRDIREHDAVYLLHRDIRYIKDLKNEISPLEFPLILLAGNNTVEVELRRENQVLDRAVTTFLAPPLSSGDGNSGGTLNSKGHDEIFKKELSVSSSRSLARALPQIPKLYYLLFGISVFGNLLFLWKA